MQRNNAMMRVDPSKLGLPSTAGLPDSLTSNLQAMQGLASQNYNTGSFHARHPVLGAGLDALIGLATLSPANAVAFPLLGAQKEQRRKSAITNAYQEYMNTQLDRQKTIDEIGRPRFERQDVNQGLQTEMDAGRINPNTPMLDQNGIYSTDYLKSRQSGAMNPASLGLLDAITNTQQEQSYGLPNKQSYFHPTGGLQEGIMQQATSNSPLFNAGAREYRKPIETPYDPSSLPTFISDQTFGNLQQAQTGAATNALTTGQNRYEFDQEEPKRAAEIQKALAEGDAAKALGLLRGAQTATEKQKPGLIKAQTSNQSAQAGFNRERYRGGPAPQRPQLPTSASELARLYQSGAFGQPGTPEATQGYIGALTRSGAGGDMTTSTVYQRDDEGRVTGTTQTRSKGGARAPAPRPGKSVPLSTGREAKI